MSAFENARLEVLNRNGDVVRSIAVQFNPSTMNLQMTNSIDGGTTRGRQVQQYNGTSSTTLTFDLEYDTADEGTSERPVDVRTRTAEVAQFVLPGGEGSKQAPPRLKFRWGTFELIGVMASLTEELSLFASSGAPLRSKLSVSIKEQDPKFEALERANRNTRPPAAGEGNAGTRGGPGTRGGGPADRAAAALAGETPADFLARHGLAPEAWRALGGALDALAGGVELEAGLSVDFDAALSVGVGLGVSAGFQAGLDLPLGASLGLEGGTSAGGGGSAGRGGATSGLQQGFALSSAGGLTAAADTATSRESAAAEAEARARFGVTGTRSAALSATSTAAGSARSPLSTAPTVRTHPPVASPPAPLPPPADPRRATFGRGVPLRDRVVVPGTEANGYVVVNRAARREECRP